MKQKHTKYTAINKKIVIVYKPVRNNQQAIHKTNRTGYGLTESDGTKKTEKQLSYKLHCILECLRGVLIAC